ncbi:Bifunctional folD protein [Phytophthora nicotianae]|uniref:Bifunctional folD protein n=1 Tax=Phytophthora nicotianae TaxID=4792 RepID=A0A0W8D3W0_PHYNI|nr:Bifunctional folD protein [Phytophthora nicotianae]
MSPAISTTASWSARVTVPRSTLKEDDEFSSSANSSRYRMLDVNQKQRETEDVERIISDLEAQRRYRTNSRPKRRQETAVVPIRSGSPSLNDKSTRLKESRGSSRFSFDEMAAEGDESLPVNRENYPVDAVSQSFQDQVLEELRKLKESQRIEFEALERLQREKDEAERKARRLEQKLREQQRQLSQSKEKSTRHKTRPDIILREESDEENNEKICSCSNSDTEDANCKDDSEEVSPELSDWDDATKSPPPYHTVASPAAEAEQLAKEATEKLERAHRAAPPQRLLEREALAQQRKSQHHKVLEQEWKARSKRAKARDVPLTTYLSAEDAEEAEQKRKQRIRQRAQEMMQSAELPPRMAIVSKNSYDDGEDERMTVKMKKKLRAAAEEEVRTQRNRPKPVPNFDQLHSKWETALKKRKELSRRNEEEEANDTKVSAKKNAEFFISRAAKLAELQEKKEARKQRQQAKEQAIQQHARRTQEKLLARTRASLATEAGSQWKPTKSETLRVQKLMAEAAKQEKERQREEREAEARERRREEAARRVRAQVKRSESARRDNYAGNFVDLKDMDVVAKEKAREQRQQFKEAIARNKEKLLVAAATRPSLMERFSTDVKRETHRRAALESVVKTVFQKDLSTLKGVLTDDEQELATAMIAADDENSEAS